MNVRISRIGRKPVVIPSGVQAHIQGDQLTVKGPKGNLSLPLHPFVNVQIDKNEIRVTPKIEARKFITGKSIKLYKSIPGTMRAKISNLVSGVSETFERKLILVGVGYRAQIKGKNLSLNLGLSHPTDFLVPEGITIETPTQTEIVIKGANKKDVGEIAAQIRRIRPPEPYKGKGVRYADEKIDLKETKKK